MAIPPSDQRSWRGTETLSGSFIVWGAPKGRRDKDFQAEAGGEDCFKT
jgi:hypothetical protein